MAALGQAANPNLGVSIYPLKRLLARVELLALLVLRLWPAVRCAQGLGPPLTRRATGSRALPLSAPLRVAGKTSRPDLALHGPLPGQISYQKAEENRRASNEW